MVHLPARLLLACLLLSAIPCPLHAQAGKGALLGNIADTAGLPMPGATVTITETSTKLSPQLNKRKSGALSMLVAEAPIVVARSLSSSNTEPRLASHVSIQRCRQNSSSRPATFSVGLALKNE